MRLLGKLNQLTKVERQGASQSPLALVNFESLETVNESIARITKINENFVAVKEDPAGDFFGDDVYVREWKAKAGSFVIGKVHKTNHVFIMITGKMISWTQDKGLVVLKAPCIFEGKAGSQRVLFTLEDTCLATAHGLPGVYDVQPDREHMREHMTFGTYAEFVKSEKLEWDPVLCTFIPSESNLQLKEKVCTS